MECGSLLPLSHQQPAADQWIPFAVRSSEHDLHSRLWRWKAAAGCSSPKTGAKNWSNNVAAWASLFLDSVDEQVYNDARNSAQLGAYRDVATIHTLAAVCAEMGRIEEAQTLLEKCLQERPGHEPTSDESYISCRIADYLKLPEIAQFYYDKVISIDTSTSVYSTSALAQKRRGNVMKPVSFRSKSTH